MRLSPRLNGHPASSPARDCRRILLYGHRCCIQLRQTVIGLCDPRVRFITERDWTAEGDGRPAGSGA